MNVDISTCLLTWFVGLKFSEYTSVCKEGTASHNLTTIACCRSYHGRPEPQRRQVQQDWIDNKVHILIATSASCMGINKPDVRLMVHYSLPKSMNEYHQVGWAK